MADDLDVVVHHLLELLADLPHPPDALRIGAEGVAVEVEWPPAVAGNGTTGSGAAGTQGAPIAVAPAPVGTGPSADAPGPETGNGSTDHRHVVRAPTVGTFQARRSPGSEPLVAVGDRVGAGAQVATVRVMSLPVPVRADVGGRVVEVLAEDGEPVEYDQPLVVLDPSPDGPAPET